MWRAQPRDQSSAEYTADVKNIETWKIPKCRISLIVRSSVTRSELSGLLPLIFAASTASFDGGRSIAGSPYLLFCTTPTSSGSSCSTKMQSSPPSKSWSPRVTLLWWFPIPPSPLICPLKRDGRFPLHGIIHLHKTQKHCFGYFLVFSRKKLHHRSFADVRNCMFSIWNFNLKSLWWLRWIVKGQNKKLGNVEHFRKSCAF